MATSLLALPLCGCLVIPDFSSDADRNVPLSVAMKASASGGRDPVPDPGNSGSGTIVMAFDDDGSDYGENRDASGEGAMVDYGRRQFSWQIPVEAGAIVPLNGDIEEILRFSLTPVAFEDERNYLGFYIAGGEVKFKHGTLPDRATRDSFLLEVGTTYRRYFNDPHTFVSPYITASAAWQPVFWRYESPIFVPDERIRGDMLNGVTGSLGLGVAFWRRHHVSVFCEAGVGGTVFVGDTREGFSNDVLSDFGYALARAGITFKF